jgi:imidazoleglycerol-phosphate dehydratase
MPSRQATIERQTKETSIRVELNLDGGEARIATGVGFFDHMLEHLAKHGRLGLIIEAQGDTQVDDHHTIEDVGIALGQALEQALGDKAGIERFGFASVPMDEALTRASLDLSGRAALVFDVAFQSPTGKIGEFDVQLVQEFFRALTSSGRFNAHLESPRGSNDHHIAEALFKAFARGLREATRITGEDVPSTKGSL